MCSPFLTAFLSEKIGRKKTLLVFVLPTIISHLILIFAKRVVDFYVARFLIGVFIRGSVYFEIIHVKKTVNLITMAAGAAFTWASPVLPKLRDHDSTVNPLGEPLTNFEESWIASIMMMGAFTGPFAAGMLSEKLGKKKALLIFGLPMTASHLICAFATTPNLFLVARFLIGIGVGGVFSVIPSYVGEISEDNNRGVFGSMLGLIAAFGQICCYAVGPLVSVRWFSLINLIPLALFYVLFGVFVPGSPYDLVRRNDQTEAERSLTKLRRRTGAQVQKELIYITETVETDSENRGSISDLFTNKSVSKAIIICCGLMVFQQCSGICAVLAYMQSIFEVSGASISPFDATIIISTISMLTNFASSMLIDRMGRKLLLAISSLIAALCMLTLGLYFFLRSAGRDTTYISWLPIMSLIAFMVAFNLGFANIPWIFLGELFPSNVKSSASTLTASVCFSLSFLITICFPFLSASLGEAGSFWIFGGVLVIGHAFILTVVPETKGKSFKEIQDMLSGTQKQIGV
ncbi:facilitated trehalose transporter Tret1-like isoform X2 [Cylas formicarius]|nr:facilitated trehalose transporter Tret1-like isoform X2 [Cylas formicarius]